MIDYAKIIICKISINYRGRTFKYQGVAMTDNINLHPVGEKMKLSYMKYNVNYVNSDEILEEFFIHRTPKMARI
jgi:hypothetical protein